MALSITDYWGKSAHTWKDSCIHRTLKKQQILRSDVKNFYQIRRVEACDVKVKLENGDDVAGNGVGQTGVVHQNLENQIKSMRSSIYVVN